MSDAARLVHSQRPGASKRKPSPEVAPIHSLARSRKAGMSGSRWRFRGPNEAGSCPISSPQKVTHSPGNRCWAVTSAHQCALQAEHARLVPGPTLALTPNAVPTALDRNDRSDPTGCKLVEGH